MKKYISNRLFDPLMYLIYICSELCNVIRVVDLTRSKVPRLSKQHKGYWFVVSCNGQLVNLHEGSEMLDDHIYSKKFTIKCTLFWLTSVCLRTKPQNNSGC